MTLLDQFDGEIPDSIPTDTEPKVCIHCGSDRIHPNMRTMVKDSAIAEMFCPDCKTRWTEQFAIAEITKIRLFVKPQLRFEREGFPAGTEVEIVGYVEVDDVIVRLPNGDEIQEPIVDIER